MSEQEPKEAHRDSQALRPKGLLYHYTSADGRIGIIRSDNLRATHFRYLNDTEEIIDSLKYLDSYIEKLDPIPRPVLERFLRSTINSFTNGMGAYVISFTDDSAALDSTNEIPGDRLSQWRAYCSAGKGFSLGFDPNSFDSDGLGEPIASGSSLAYLHNCVYSQESKQRILRGAASLQADDLLNVLLDFTKHRVETTEWARGETLENYLAKLGRDTRSFEEMLAALTPELRERLMQSRRNLMLGLIVNATSFKDGAFFEEKEWRIIIHPSGHELQEIREEAWAESPVKFRNGALGITPYVEFPLNLRTRRSPLKKIVVGPTPHMAEALQATRMLLERSGIKVKADNSPEGVEVVPSKIPFRYW